MCSKESGRDIEIERSLPQPFIETPLMTGRHGFREVATVVLSIMLPGLRDPVIEERLSICADSLDLASRKKSVPPGETSAPESTLSSNADPRK